MMVFSLAYISRKLMLGSVPCLVWVQVFRVAFAACGGPFGQGLYICIFRRVKYDRTNLQ